MSFRSRFQEDALVASGRHCCLCRRFCGLKLELHHVRHKASGGADTFENCIPVCFDCHADMRSYDHKHPKGTKYTESELVRHRDEWYRKVKGNPGPSYGAPSLELDKKMLQAIVKLLPYKRTISLLQRHHFGAPFRSSLFGEFDDFANESDDPAMEFIDPDLEGIRVSLVEEIHQFSHYLARHAWRIDETAASVPREWSISQLERFDEVVGKLNAMSTSIAETYAQLIRQARRRLSVDLSEPQTPN